MTPGCVGHIQKWETGLKWPGWMGSSRGKDLHSRLERWHFYVQEPTMNLSIMTFWIFSFYFRKMQRQENSYDVKLFRQGILESKVNYVNRRNIFERCLVCWMIDPEVAEWVLGWRSERVWGQAAVIHFPEDWGLRHEKLCLGSALKLTSLVASSPTLFLSYRFK